MKVGREHVPLTAAAPDGTARQLRPQLFRALSPYPVPLGTATVLDRVADLATEATAEFSECRTYRYALTRTWDAGRLPLAFVMLNPSTADAFTVDPTIRRCLGFAQAWGAGGLLVLNVYGLRSTDPKALRGHSDPVGPDNDATIVTRLANPMARVVGAWGAHARPDRAAYVIDLIREAGHQPVCLGRTKAGAPRHPLYLRADSQPDPL